MFRYPIKKTWQLLGTRQRDRKRLTRERSRKAEGQSANPKPFPSTHLKDISPFEAQLVIRRGFEVVLGDGFHAGAGAAAPGGKEALPAASAAAPGSALPRPGSVRGSGAAWRIQERPGVGPP